MTKKKKLFTTLALSALSVFCLGVGAACGGEGAVGEEYDWTYNRPFAGEPDEYMTIDGVLDEDVWQEKTKLTHTAGPKSWEVATHFTQKGIYIGLKVEDSTIFFNTRFTSRSFFGLYLCKTGTQTVDLNGLAAHQARYFSFLLDPYYCRSNSRIPYYYEAYVEGEVNSEETEYMTAELFLTWEDLNYKPDELTENGYPESIQMYVNYEGESSEVLGSCLWREETFFHYNKDGYMGEIDHEDLGAAQDGPSATDQWYVNEDGNLETRAGRTQIAWLKDAFSTDFMFEAELRPIGTTLDGEIIKYRGAKVGGRCGLILQNTTAVSANNYSVFSFLANAVVDRGDGAKQLALQSCRQIDSLHWNNLVGVSGTPVKDHTGDTVVLRVIKQGDTLYYFYGDTYWKSERVVSMDGSVYCGFYTSQGMEIVDYTFLDYADDSAALASKLSEYMYFVNVSGKVSGGSVTTSEFAVAHGKSVTLSFKADSKNMVTRITRDGEDVYDEVTSEMDEMGNYVYTPTADVTFEAKFTQFAAKDLVQTVVAFYDAQNERVSSASYQITSSEKTVFFQGETNDTGYVSVQIPKKGEYVVDGRTVQITGEYHAEFSFTGHHPTERDFVLDNDVQSIWPDGKNQTVTVGTDRKFGLTCVLDENAWGKVTVNGTSIGSSMNNVVQYNAETGNYYMYSSTFAYMKDMVSDVYSVEAQVTLSEMQKDSGDPQGIILSTGAACIILKTSYNEGAGRLIIATGNHYQDSAFEVSITGFAHNIAWERSTFNIHAVRYANKIYLLSGGVVKVVLSAQGLQLANGAAFSWNRANEGKYTKEEINAQIDADLADFFKASKPQNVVGMMRYGTSDRVEWDFEYTTNPAEVKAEIGYGEVTMQTETDEYTATLNGTGFIRGEQVEIVVVSKDPKKAVSKLLLTTQDGSEEISGTYDMLLGGYVFTFTADGDVTVTARNYSDIFVLSGKVLTSQGTAAAFAKLEIIGIGVIENAVNEEGDFEIFLAAGTYDLRVSTQTEVAYVAVNLTEDTTQNVTLTSNLYDVANYGGAIAQGGTYQKADLLDGTFTAAGTNYSIIFPNTATAENFEYVVTVTDVVRSHDESTFGLLLSDGKHNLTVVFRKWQLCINLGYRAGNGYQVWYSTTKAFVAGTYRIVKTSNEISVYFGSDHLFTLTKDGVEVMQGYLKHLPTWTNSLFASTESIAAYNAFFDKTARLAIGTASATSHEGSATYQISTYRTFKQGEIVWNGGWGEYKPDRDNTLLG